MNAPRTITVFRCEPLRGAELTRSSCGQRWESFNGKGPKRTAHSGPALAGRECIDCPIGKAHADGDRPERWPSGRVIELRDKPVPAVASPTPVARAPRAQERPKPERPAQPPAPPTAAQDAPVESTERADVEPAPAPPIPTGGKPSELPPAPAAEPEDVDVPVTMKPDYVAELRRRAERPHALARPMVRDGDVGDSSVEPMRGRVVVVDGVSRTVDEWARHLGLTVNAIYERVRRSWPIELAVSAPRGSSYEHATLPIRVRGDKPPRARGHVFESQRVTHDGRTQDVLAWAHETGVSIDTVKQRMRGGDTLEAACTTPNKTQARATAARARRDAVEAPTMAPGSPMRLPIVDELPLTPEGLLRAAGYDIVQVSRVPAGVAIIIREPA